MKFRNDKILAIKHTFYICFIFPLPFRMLILFFVNAVYGISTLSVRKRGDSYKDIVSMFNADACICISHCIVSVSLFSIPFRFPFRVLVTPPNQSPFPPCDSLQWNANIVQFSDKCKHEQMICDITRY